MKRFLASAMTAAAVLVPSLAAAAPVVLEPVSPVYMVDLCRFGVQPFGSGLSVGPIGKPICSKPADKFEIPFSSSLLCSGKTVIKNKNGVVKTAQFVADACVVAD